MDIAERILLRGDTLDNWTRANPRLLSREPAVVFDEYYVGIKIGNGVANFNDLPYSVYTIKIDGDDISPKERPYVDLDLLMDMGPGTGPGTGTVSKYTHTFNATTNWTTDWSAAIPFSLLVPETTHEQGMDIVADVYRLVAGNYVKTEGFPTMGHRVMINALNGNVILSAEERFAGKIVIM